MENLERAIRGMKNWHRFGWWLDVPLSKRDEIKKKIPTLAKQREALLQEWLEHHPCPNWRLFAWALLRRREPPEHEMLMQLYGNYIPGILGCNNIIYHKSGNLIWLKNNFLQQYY